MTQHQSPEAADTPSIEHHVLLIGNGGREHALAWKLSLSPRVSRISVIPGNPGMAAETGVSCVDVDATDFAALVNFAKTG